jgi:hypothetical protein
LLIYNKNPIRLFFFHLIRYKEVMLEGEELTKKIVLVKKGELFILLNLSRDHIRKHETLMKTYNVKNEYPLVNSNRKYNMYIKRKKFNKKKWVRMR